MKNFKFLGFLFAVFLFVGCQKDEATSPGQELGDFSIRLNDFYPNTGDANRNAGNDEDIPDCSDSEPDYVIAIIGGVEYKLNLLDLSGNMETEVIKLPVADYILSDFSVWDDNGTPLDDTDDVVIYASPVNGSYYQDLWDLDGVSKTFTIIPFQKILVTVDVLCYVPFDYEDFGFVWFKYDKYRVKTICFFGDVCTKFYEEWHAEVDGNPYFGQEYFGQDFVAIFDVIIKDDQGNTVNDLTLNSNLPWQGVGAPLCVEYPDNEQVDGEQFTAEIWLRLPNGTLELVHTEAFDDTACSDTENSVGGDQSDWGGDDGIFDFVVGNCSYVGNDADLELPAWMPIPSTLDMTLTSGVDTYVIANIDNVAGGTDFDEIFNGTFGAWCGDQLSGISLGTTYSCNVYSSLDLGAMPIEYASYGLRWNALNWLINQVDLSTVNGQGTYSMTQVQNGIWNLIHGFNFDDGGFMLANGIDLSGGFASVENYIKSYQPTVGGWAFVLLDPIEIADEDMFQLIIIQVDP